MIRGSVTSLFILFPLAVNACECIKQGLEDKLNAATDIVTARIETFKEIPKVITNFPDMYEINFIVDEVIKGEHLTVKQNIIVVTPSDEGSCGVPLDSTRKYRLVLSAYDFDEKATIVTCDGSGIIE